ncbi:Acid phosphatase [Pararobbsia alpina]|uniref:acid phosphatase n=1 Tax=Pararobbsia alpina TaxID=621374 RepID=UPI0039A6B70C
MNSRRPYAFVQIAWLVSASVFSGLANADTAHYLDPHQVDLAALLAPPPAATSALQQADLKDVLEIQRSRTPEQVQRAQGDTEKSVFRFADVLGPQFTEANLPKTAALFKRAASDAAMIAKEGKDHFHRLRPYLASNEVHPSVALDPKDIDNSYPSGHATFGYMSAILLAQMVPEQSAALFARGREYGDNRVIDGVHYPSDVEAGRIDGTLVAAALMNNAEFQQAFADARAEVRHALSLP